MSEKGLIQEKRLLKRLVISQNDLYHAQWYANLILSKNLHHSEMDENKYLHSGLNTALIVTYWRPFSKNKDRKRDTQKELPTSFLSDFTPEEENLHGRIKELRDRDFAHSDADGHDVKINVEDFSGASLAIPISRNAYIPLDQRETEMLRHMIGKLLHRISPEILRIQKQLSIGDYF